MAKRTAQQTAPTQTDNEAGLDQTLSDAGSSASDFMKKYRFHSLALLVALVATTALYVGVISINEAGLTRHNADLWNFIMSPAAQEYHNVTIEQLDALAAEARDSESDRFVLKSIGEYLFSLVEASSVDGATEKPNAISADVARTKALAIADEALNRFGDDNDMVTWASGVKAKLENTGDAPWLPKSPDFTLPSPTGS
ncbi:MAG: hypothetical protein MK538_13450 [Planctomycetes bacterium]|nr:hypothetical protein [Planctomycetota bacterium]